MKKEFKSYLIIWGAFLVLYNLVVFLMRPIIPGYTIIYDARFWISWGVVMATYVGHLFCAKEVFNAKNIDKVFLNLPLAKHSFGSIIAITVVSSALMLIPDCPAWIAAIVCALILLFSAIAVIKSKVVADAVGEVDEKIKQKTMAIKLFIVDAESIMNSAKDQTIKAECRKVYEALRYSDPMSAPALESLEQEIESKLRQLKNSVLANTCTENDAIVNELLVLIKERNNKCKILK